MKTLILSTAVLVAMSTFGVMHASATTQRQSDQSVTTNNPMDAQAKMMMSKKKKMMMMKKKKMMMMKKEGM